VRRTVGCCLRNMGAVGERTQCAQSPVDTGSKSRLALSYISQYTEAIVSRFSYYGRRAESLQGCARRRPDLRCAGGRTLERHGHDEAYASEAAGLDTVLARAAQSLLLWAPPHPDRCEGGRCPLHRPEQTGSPCHLSALHFEPQAQQWSPLAEYGTGGAVSAR
jgi:hypothetical protein